MNTPQIRTAHNYLGDLTIGALEDIEKRLDKIEKNMDKLLMLILIKLHL